MNFNDGLKKIDLSRKEVVQTLLIAIAVAVFSSMFFGLNPLYALVLALVIVGAKLADKVKQFQTTEKKRLKHLICITPSLMHKTLMLIYGGVHCVNSLVDSFEAFEQDAFIGPAVSQFTTDLKTGTPLEGAILSFNVQLRYKSLGKMLQRIALYEQTGNTLVLEQLKMDLSELNEEKYSYLVKQLNQADMASMLPSLIHLLIMMVLLMSPILLGGMQL